MPLLHSEEYEPSEPHPRVSFAERGRDGMGTSPMGDGAGSLPCRVLRLQQGRQGVEVLRPVVRDLHDGILHDHAAGTLHRRLKDDLPRLWVHAVQPAVCSLVRYALEVQDALELFVEPVDGLGELREEHRRVVVSPNLVEGSVDYDDSGSGGPVRYLLDVDPVLDGTSVSGLHDEGHGGGHAQIVQSGAVPQEAGVPVLPPRTFDSPPTRFDPQGAT